VILNAAGGHPGENPNYCPIRRFTAPASGTLSITGTLAHGSENGDGVRGRIVSSRSGLLGEWTATNGSAGTLADGIEVAAGDTIDLIVDGREHVTSDSFQWPVQIVLIRDGRELAKWSSPEGFHGPLMTAAQIHPAHLVRAWQRVYLRSPSESELRAAIAFVTAQLQQMQLEPANLPEGRSAEQQALTNLCQALLVSNEFLYVE